MEALRKYRYAAVWLGVLASIWLAGAANWPRT
jgi:hypothetical protein